MEMVNELPKKLGGRGGGKSRSSKYDDLVEKVTDGNVWKFTDEDFAELSEKASFHAFYQTLTKRLKDSDLKVKSRSLNDSYYVQVVQVVEDEVQPEQPQNNFQDQYAR